VRTSPLRGQVAAAGALFSSRHGVEVVSRFGACRAEHAAVRDAVGLTDFSFMRVFRLPEEQGIDFLDGLVAGNVPKIRFGRVLHTFLADRDGLLVADCYVANNDQEFIFTCESILPDPQLDVLLLAAGLREANAEDLTTTHALLSLDGFKSWEIVKNIFGPDTVGLPYLSIENCSFGGEPVCLLRAGKTSEFGYLLMAPVKGAAALFDALKSETEQRGGRLCGVQAHDDLRLEGRFFNIFREGQRVRDPLPLGLQWMIDFDKDNFSGCAAIKQRRTGGLRRKIIGVAAQSEQAALEDGARIFHEGREVAEVVASGFSVVLDQPLALALFPVELAYSGLSFRLGAPDGPVVRSLSMPPIMPKSLMVKLDEM